MSYFIYDAETTIVERYKRKANPFVDDNWLVAEGWKLQGDTECSWRYMDEKTSRSSFLRIPKQASVLVGHNLKFDLLWELSRRNTDLARFLKDGGQIWCTQYAEYLLRAQHPKWHMCSLNDTSIAYGGTPKIDMVKAMWEDGINTPDIPEDLLIDYLVGTEAEKRNGGDIGNTENIYVQQVKKAKKLGMYKMIQDRMDGLLATTFMEYFGLRVDTVFAKTYLAEKKAELAVADKELAKFIPELPPELTFNWNSNIHKSALIYGGAVKYVKSVKYLDPKTGEYARKNEVEAWPLFNKVAENSGTRAILFNDDKGMWADISACPIDWTDPTEGVVDWTNAVWQDVNKGGKNMGAAKFKNVTVKGALKTRKTDFVFDFKGYTKPDHKWQGAMLDARGKAIYSADADIVEQLTKRGDVPFLVALGRFSALTKEIGTYLVARDPKTGKLKGMLTCVDPQSLLIHHKVNHTNTITSRLSSSDPNLQNLTRGDYNSDTGIWKSEVKRMFISRWPDGRMVEADYSQLEVVVQGVLTKDRNLCRDLMARVDFHCKRVSAAKGCTYEEALEWCKNEAHIKYAIWDVFRTHAKIFSFQRAYGAGAKTIADETGMSLEDVEALIAEELVMYPEVEEYYAEVQKEIERTSEPIRAQRDNGSYGVYRRGYYTAPTGTRYTWRSYDAPAFLRKRGITDTFSPPEIRNYPVQGTGGEFVQGVLGLLIRDLIKKDFYGGGMFDPCAILCNTVHDCVWYDCKTPEISKTVWADVQPIMESIPEFYNERHGMDIIVPFPVDGEVGLNMNQLGHFE